MQEADDKEEKRDARRGSLGQTLAMLREIAGDGDRSLPHHEPPKLQPLETHLSQLAYEAEMDTLSSSAGATAGVAAVLEILSGYFN